MQNDVFNDFHRKQHSINSTKQASQWHQQAASDEQLTRNSRTQSNFTSKPTR